MICGHGSLSKLVGTSTPSLSMQVCKTVCEDMPVHRNVRPYLQVLLEHGRLRAEQMLALVASSKEEDPKELEGDVSRCLVNLVYSKYVQRARGCDAERPQRPLPSNVKVRAELPVAWQQCNACSDLTMQTAERQALVGWLHNTGARSSMACWHVMIMLIDYSNAYRSC